MKSFKVNENICYVNFDKMNYRFEHFQPNEWWKFEIVNNGIRVFHDWDKKWRHLSNEEYADFINNILSLYKDYEFDIKIKELLK